MAFRLVCSLAFRRDRISSMSSLCSRSHGACPSIDPAVLKKLVAEAEAKQVLARDIVNGTLLDKLADEHADHFARAAPGRPTAPSLELTWASICSGGEGVLFALDGIVKAYAKRGIELKLRHVFSCECKKVLQEWIQGAFDEAGIASGCAFDRAEHMGRDTAWCVKHKKPCRVPDSDIVIAGSLVKTSVGRVRCTRLLRRRYCCATTLWAGPPRRTGAYWIICESIM